MQIPADLLNTWKSLRSRGDNAKLFPEAKSKKEMDNVITIVARAFNSRSCSDELFVKLKDFYTKKEKQLFPERFNTTGHE